MNADASKTQLLAAFIGPRAQAYLPADGNKNAFSWAGLIFGAYWLLYRKMYAYFFVTVVFAIFIGLVAQIIGVPAQNAAWLGFLPNIAIGCMGKRLYTEFAAQKVKAYQRNPKYSAEVFAEAGGVSWSMPLLWLFTQTVAVLMLSMPFLKY